VVGQKKEHTAEIQMQCL